MKQEAAEMLAYDLLMAMPATEGSQTYTERDTILYNLGIGFGAAAIEDAALLRYVLEQGLTSFPTMASVLGATSGGDWFHDPRYGIDVPRVVHGEEELEIFGPLPVSGTIHAVHRIEGFWDRGVEKGAVMRLTKTLRDITGQRLAATSTILVLRGNGGFGGTIEGMPHAAPLPERIPDGAVDVMTRPEQALIYRLSGDTNPLHAVPAAAQLAGFPRPILHGLCSFGVAARALLSVFADGDATRLRRFGLRVASPVYPGETLRIEYWRLGEESIAFRARVVERDVVVLTGGRASIGAHGVRL